MSESNKRIFSNSVGAPQDANLPDPQTHTEPQLIARDRILELLAAIGSPDSLKDAVTQNPEQVFQLLHSSYYYQNLDLKNAKDSYDQLQIESTQRQEVLQGIINNQVIAITGYENQIQGLNQSLSKARMRAERPQSSSTPSHSIRSPKFPHPPMFDGTRLNLDVFKIMLKSKLRVNEDWYPTPEAQINYAFGRLEGKAEQQILPRMNPNNAAFIKDMPSFYQALESYFGDPDKKWTAQHFIIKLRQANKPFAEYLSQFQAHIGKTGFDGANQLYFFKNGLSKELSTYLIPMNTKSMDLNTLIETCQKLDNELRRIQQRNTSNP